MVDPIASSVLDSTADARLPFEVGALYSRRSQIHGLLGGQQQGGISTPPHQPFILIFTGEAGKSHGYEDFWDDDGIFHYFGEGQCGDMQMSRGNLAIDRHIQAGKRLLLFKAMGHGKPYRFDGEFIKVDYYLRPDTPATRGPSRIAIVFRLRPVNDGVLASVSRVAEATPEEMTIESTAAFKLTEIRTKQDLFKRRLIGVEKACRLTQVMDLRFLRASHIKPWSACATGDERTDGNNGLLLTPQADLLFDRGWITFENKGALCIAEDLPSDVQQRLGLKLKPGRNCGSFNDRQRAYLEYHRNAVYEKRYKKQSDPVGELISSLK